MNRNYKNGRSYEYKARDTLLEQGYLVTRSAGSHGVIDLVAIGADHFLLVQVKSGKAKMDALERKIFDCMKVPFNCRKEIWTYKFRKPMRIEVI